MQIQKKKSLLSTKKLLIFVFFIIVLTIVGFGVYAKKTHLWPFQESVPSDSIPKLPIDKDELSNESLNNKTTSSNGSVNSTSTKVGGKTPLQYEGETQNDTPAYNNEQFRIPESQ